MTYIVTGGAGFIGSAFVAKLNAAGINDVIVVDDLGTNDKWKNLRGKRLSDVIQIEEFSRHVASNVMPSNVEAIIHMGAISSTTEMNADALMHYNFRYSRMVAEYALRQDVRFIYASSAATYGDGSLGYSDDHALIPKLRPLNGYGFSKNLFDQWALDHGHLSKLCGFRFFNVYGPNEYHKEDQRSVVVKAWRTVKDGGAIKLFKSNTPKFKDGEQKRDFVYVKDCSEVMWRALENSKINGVFNLGTGTARSWIDLARAVFSAMGVAEKIEFVAPPAQIDRAYQNFTEAKMEKLTATGVFPSHFSLEDGVRDYIVNYLETPDPYL